MSLSAILFVDYQNVYRWARNVFGAKGLLPSSFGQIAPETLAAVLEQKSRNRFQINQIRIYRGLPSQHRDPMSYSAVQRQVNYWRKGPRTQVFLRTLSYPKIEQTTRSAAIRPQEKGIDVALAVDFVALAFLKKFEVGLIFSADTDLRPALEFVRDSTVSATGEVVGWRGKKSNYRLSLPGNTPFCHWLDEKDFSKITDSRYYGRS